jgi:hypothetical protein
LRGRTSNRRAHLLHLDHRQIHPFLPREPTHEDDDGPERWQILVDSGYQGLDRLVPSHLPHKKPPGGELNRAQREFNHRLAGQRVICERWYGRLKTRHRIICSKYRNDRDDYATHFKLCAALTNFHLVTNDLIV